MTTDKVFKLEAESFQSFRSKVSQMNLIGAIDAFHEGCDEIIVRMSEKESTHEGRKLLVLAVVELSTVAQRLGFKFPPVQFGHNKDGNRTTVISLVILDPRGERELSCPIGGYSCDGNDKVIAQDRSTGEDEVSKIMELWKIAARNRNERDLVPLTDNLENVLKLFLCELEFIRRGIQAQPLVDSTQRKMPDEQLSLDARAIAILADKPNIKTRTAVATMLGVTRQALDKCPNFCAAFDRLGQSSIRRGTKSKTGEIEAEDEE